MNSDLQPPTDELIDSELQALRMPVHSPSVGDAIRSMQAEPSRKGRPVLKWSLGFGSIAFVAGAVILFGSLTTTNAYAGELLKIAAAQDGQKLVYEKSYLYGENGRPALVMEIWTDHNRETYRQHDGNGRLEVAIVSDGKRSFHYFAGARDGSMNPFAGIDDDRSDHFGILSIDSLLQGDFFKKHKIEKKTGVKLNGHICDYYSFANGYYRVWADSVTKLPLQRDIYDKGVSLWKRSVYEYPSAFAESVFRPYKADQIHYFDFMAARKQLRQKLSGPGQSQRVGNVTITLKALVKDNQRIRAIWSTTGAQGWRDDRDTSLQISGARKTYAYFGELLPEAAPGQHLFYEELSYAAPFQLPATVRIAAWQPGPKRKFVGWASFTVKDVLTVLNNNNLLYRLSRGMEKGSLSSTGTAKANR
jgi:hypothetical protein